MFLDEAIITVRSGKGGRGCVSFRREKFIPRGGPDGGDGGDGGSVYLRASRDLTTLADISRQAQYQAGHGKHGGGNNRTGRSADHLYIDVPPGTVVREVVAGLPPQEGSILGDIVEAGQELLVARGGKGGHGNKAFATSTHQAPREFEEGREGQERKLYLELKLLADVGLIGLPNAGKSTLLSRISAATPKIADYPFTTLKPNLGITDLGDFRRLVVADIPGLIEGAHAGAGLGIEFLRHIERTSVLVHLVSAEAGSVETFVASYRTVESELSSYSEVLASKLGLVVLSKVDLIPPDEREGKVLELSRALGRKVLPLSAVTGIGLKDVLNEASRLVTVLRSPPDP
ncbi:MAG TPA: GTPase ObgE [Planctomycetota bacterium]|nr:GTPase ObgE [Planctomycetota bacterium]